MVSKLSKSKRERVKQLLESGKSIHSVARSVGCSSSTVHEIAKRASIQLSEKRGGRPKSLSSTDVKVVGRALMRNDIRTAVEGQQLLEKSLQIDVHPATVRRALRRIGFKAVVKKKKPLLTVNHRR